MPSPIVKAVSWKKSARPKKILVMRFQAMGDMVITLPYLQNLKEQLPATDLHFMTRKEVNSIPLQLGMFSKVITIYGGRNTRLQLFFCLLYLPWLWWQRYDIVIDLQNHRISRIMRRLTGVRHWSQFDRRSLVPAGIRTQSAINNAGIGSVAIARQIELKFNLPVKEKLMVSGWEQHEFIILNPAGAFASRNWPMEYYVDFARLWSAKSPGIQFLMMGFGSLSQKVSVLRTELGNKLIDLTGLTTPAEAFEIVRHAKLMLSEDSGLMHMSWTQRIPTVAIFGSTPGVWSTPLGEWTYCFNSSDLPCGNCFREVCKFNDNHCLTRWAPQTVFAKSMELLDRQHVGT